MNSHPPVQRHRPAGLRPVFAVLAFLTLAVLALATPALAQESGGVTDDEVNAVAREVYCPVCESTPLDVCQTQACADWRELIRTKLAQGQTRQQIFDYFAEQYGDRVLATPPPEGLNLLVWIWPVFAVLAGAFLFGRYLRTLRAGPATPARTTPPVDPAPEKPSRRPAADDYMARIERELKG